MLVIKRSTYFSLFWDLLTQIRGNFYRNLYQSFSGTWDFTAFWTLMNVKKQLFQPNCLSSFFNNFLMLIIFKLQITADGNVNKKVSPKNHLKLYQDNPWCKPSFRGILFVLWYRNVSFSLITVMCETKYWNK